MKLSILILTVMFAATSLITTGCKKKDDSPLSGINTKEIEKDAKDAADDAAKEADKALDNLKK